MKLRSIKKITGALGLFACLNLVSANTALAELVRPEPYIASKAKKDNGAAKKETAKVGTVLNPSATAGEIIRIVNVDSKAGEASKASSSKRDTRASRSKKTSTKTVTSRRSGSKKTVRGRAKYATLIRAAARKHGVPVSIAKAVVQVESNFNSRARGGVGEVGLMQIRPSTARMMGYRGSIKALYNPETNLEWGMRYLAGAYKRAGGDICGTILRYNAGHYAKRMNPISRRYCQRVKSILGRS